MNTYTHWKQTVFYLPKSLKCNKGDELKGTLECKQNPRNKRDLDIDIKYNFDGEKCMYDGDMNYKMR